VFLACFLVGCVPILTGCGPAQHTCVDAYDLARTKAEIAEVDKVCGHMLLEGAGGEGGGK
jgi:hypothetical protein